MGEQRDWTSMEDHPLSSIGDDVIVTDPTNRGEGRNMHVTYSVVTGGIRARRRYSDFQWLYRRLLTEVPGAFLPIIPHKRTALIGESKFHPEFVEERRRNLQIFLKGTFRIPDVKDLSHSLVAFLTAPDDQLDEAKRKVEAANPGLFSTNDVVADDHHDNVVEAKKGISNLIAKAKTVTQTKLGNMELLKTEDEDKIEAVKLYYDRMEVHVKEMHLATDKLIRSTVDEMCAFRDVGIKIAEWKFSRDHFHDTAHGRPEGRLLDDHQEIPKMMTAVAHCCSVNIRGQLEERAGAERSSLESALVRLALDVSGFQRALSTRKKLQLACTTKDGQVRQVKKQLGSAGGNNKKKDAADKLSADLHDLEKSARFLRVKLEECTARILKESDRVRPELEARLNSGLRDYARVRMEYGEKIRDAWAELMPKFEGGSSGGGDGDGAGGAARLTTIALSDGVDEEEEEPEEGAPERPPPPSGAPSETVREEKEQEEVPKDPVLGENGV